MTRVTLSTRATRVLDGIHPGVRFEAGRGRLHRLRPADLRTIRGHERVQRHVLGLERGYPDALAVEPADDPGDYDAFARVRGRAGNEESAVHDWISPAPGSGHGDVSVRQRGMGHDDRQYGGPAQRPPQ